MKLRFMEYKPEYIKQEIWAKLIAYNITETMVSHTVVSQKETEHEYKVNFSVAAQQGISPVREIPHGCDVPASERIDTNTE